MCYGSLKHAFMLERNLDNLSILMRNQINYVA